MFSQDIGLEKEVALNLSVPNLSASRGMTLEEIDREISGGGSWLSKPEPAQAQLPAEGKLRGGVSRSCTTVQTLVCSHS